MKNLLQDKSNQKKTVWKPIKSVPSDTMKTLQDAFDRGDISSDIFISTLQKILNS